jgi:hypothetical protein
MEDMMRYRRPQRFFSIIAMAVCIGLVLCVSSVSAEKNLDKGGVLYALSQGNGTVRFVWLLSPEQWTAGGWRIMDEKGRVIKERVTAAEADALAGLEQKDAESVKKALSRFSTEKDAEKKALLFSFLSLRVMTDWNFARALGFAVEVRNLDPGMRSFSVVGIDDKGKEVGVVIHSSPADPGVASPSPEPPRNLKAEPQGEGVALFWSLPEKEDRPVAFGFFVEREDKRGKKSSLTEKPAITGKDEKAANFIDRNAPPEEEVIYRVTRLDVFGRKSGPSEVKVFHPDPAAKASVLVKGEAGENQAILIWQPAKNPNSSGYVVERSMDHEGQYAPLVKKTLPFDTGKYVDEMLVGGKTYFYRVRSADSRGNLGEPSNVVPVTPKSKEAPPMPIGLKADVGRTRVRLTWEPVPFAAAGYYVERSEENLEKWMTLNPKAVEFPQYDDHTGLHAQGTLRYRVKAVGYDSRFGEPSKPVEVTLLDTVSPNPPFINSISGKDGKVVLSFEPSLPIEDVYQYYIVRSVSEHDSGLVIGDPLPAARKTFEDTFVKVGQRYWYRIVAVDRAGNRSDPGMPRDVYVSNPPIPRASAPEVTKVEDPVRHFIITIGKIPERLAALIQFRDGREGPWLLLTEVPGNAQKAVDLGEHRKGSVQYRLIYQAANGVQGEPSESVEISIP